MFSLSYLQPRDLSLQLLSKELIDVHSGSEWTSESTIQTDEHLSDYDDGTIFPALNKSFNPVCVVPLVFTVLLFCCLFIALYFSPGPPGRRTVTHVQANGDPFKNQKINCDLTTNTLVNNIGMKNRSAMDGDVSTAFCVA